MLPDLNYSTESKNMEQQGQLATAHYNGRSVVLELNDTGFDAMSVGSVELTPAQARVLIAELQVCVTKAETSR